jgi:hypothetical protein
MKLEIVVTHKWCHPEFGGERIEQNRFAMGDAVEAENFFIEKIKNQDSYYEMYSIDIVGVRD